MIRTRYSLLMKFAAVLLLASYALSSMAQTIGNEKVLYSFQNNPDGKWPTGRIVFDQQGNLYGVTEEGGTDIGTVYQLTPPAQKGDPWTETVLHSFSGKPSGDGDVPVGGLIADAAGNLYGTASTGGTGDCVLLGEDVGCGIVFEMTPPQTKGGAWTETVLYSFQGGKDGYFPVGDLTFDQQGNLFGATMFGGGHGHCSSFYPFCGTIFELSPPKQQNGRWKEKVLYAFKGGSDGAAPNGGLIFDTGGALYGTTYFGGNHNCNQPAGVGCGIVFTLKPPTSKRRFWSEKILYVFQGNPVDAGNPTAGLVFDKKGFLYGVTVGGGSGGAGTVFRVNPPTKRVAHWTESIIHSFNLGDAGGSNPMGGLAFDQHGSLFGTASAGGSNFGGTVFRMRPPIQHGKPWAYAVLYGFSGPPDGAFPTGGLTCDGVGNLYGITQAGGIGQTCQYGCGAVFEIHAFRPARTQLNNPRSCLVPITSQPPNCPH